MFAVAIALVMGALFYGMNNTHASNQAGTTPTSQTAQTPAGEPRSASGHARRDAAHQQRSPA